MRLDQHVGHGDVAGQIGPLALQPRILVIADIVPGPAVECALPHRRRIVRRQVVAQAVALVHHAPQVACRGCDRLGCAVAQAGGEDPPVAAIGIERQHVGTLLLANGADIAGGADRYEHRASVAREHQVARGVSAGRQMRHHYLRLAARPQIAGLIGKPHDPARSPPHRQSAVPVPAARTRCRTDRTDRRQTRSIADCVVRLARRAGCAHGRPHSPRRRRRHSARHAGCVAAAKPAGELLDLEARRHVQRGAGRPPHHRRCALCRLRGVRCRHASAVMCRTTPGASACQSPYAAVPVNAASAKHGEASSGQHNAATISPPHAPVITCRCAASNAGRRSGSVRPQPHSVAMPKRGTTSAGRGDARAVAGRIGVVDQAEIQRRSPPAVHRPPSGAKYPSSVRSFGTGRCRKSIRRRSRDMQAARQSPPGSRYPSASPGVRRAASRNRDGSRTRRHPARHRPGVPVR